MKALGVVCHAGLFVAVLMPSAHAQDSFEDYFWSSRVTTGFDYSSGDYGQADTTTIAFLPVTLQSARGPLTLKVSGGALRVAGPALILDGAATGGAAPAANRKVSGLADTSVSAMYSLRELYDEGVYIDFTVRAKFPTASFKKGLGTGEVDGVVQADGAFAWGDLMPFATIGYKSSGSPDAYKLRHVTFGSLGLQYAWNERTATGVVYDYRQSSLATSPSDPQEGMAYVSYRFTDAWSLNVYGVAGFSKNSPKAGAGITFTYRVKAGAVAPRR
jgi:hypothetical protein